MTYRSRSRFKGIGLYQPLRVEDGKVIMQEVVNGRMKWYGVYAEDRDCRQDYETFYINSECKQRRALGEEYLPDDFKSVGFRAMFLGEFSILRLYRALVPRKERKMLSREKFCSGDFSELTEHFDKPVGCLVVANWPNGFISHDTYLDIIEDRRLNNYERKRLERMGFNPPKDYIIRC